MNTDLSPRPFCILHLEDNDDDHLLLAETLRADGLECDLKLARSGAEFTAAICENVYDLIISDYSLPSYDGLSALAAAREHHSDIPFIFFSGTMGEEIAVNTLKLGAIDFVLKQRPGRLAAAVRRALYDSSERTRLKTSEQALRESEERFRVVARTTNDVVWEWNMHNNQVWISNNFETAFGHAIANTWISSEQWFDYLHPDDKTQVTQSMASLIACGNRVWWGEHRLRRADGSYAYVFDRASIIYNLEGKPQKMVGVKIDMTERKVAEEKIHEQAALLDKATDAIIVCTLNHEITFWNQGAERVYGWSAAEAVGKNLRKLFFSSGLPSQIYDSDQSMKKSGEWKGELQQCTKSGSTVTVNSRKTLIRDKRGEPKTILIINTDITEHKLLEEQFLRSQRQESLGSLVSGIAHDLNNTLMPIIIGVEILQMEPLSQNAAGMLNTMRASAKRSSEMVKQMLLFARGGESDKSLIQAEQLLKEMAKIINDTFPKAVTCHMRTEKNLCPIYGVPTQIHQVLMNLCVNARDAMAGKGTLTLTAEGKHVNKQEAASLAGARDGDFVCFSVADSGAGIPAEQLEKIFQPFFTTKAPGKGTGLGLSTCQRIINSHDGFITVDSKVGVGTEFKIYLPAIGDKSPGQPSLQSQSLSSGHGEGILVVDDEESILAMCRAVLENFGYAVNTAATGMDAITCFRNNPDMFKLVIVDQIMPLLDGHATVEALRKIQPDLKIIVASGVPEGEAMIRFQNFKAIEFLSKPFTAEELLSFVGQILEENGK